eukprot:2819427-Prymnesium_polylepis.1
MRVAGVVVEGRATRLVGALAVAGRAHPLLLRRARAAPHQLGRAADDSVGAAARRPSRRRSR